MLVEGYQVEDRAALIERLPVELCAQLLSQMDRNRAAATLEKVDLGTALKLLEALPISTAEVLLRQIDEAFCNVLLDTLDPKLSTPIKRALAYPRTMVGACMEPLVFTLTDDLTVGQSLERIKKDNPSLLSHVFVLSRNHVLAGIVEVKQLIVADRNTLIREIMDTRAPKTLANMSLDVLLEGRGWEAAYSFLAVTDTDGVFLGLITRESITGVSREKTSYKKQAAQTSSALADLFQIGLSSLFTSTVASSNDKNINQ